MLLESCGNIYIKLWNAPEPTINLECFRAYRCCSAFNELGVFHLHYYVCHVKLNILGRIVIPDKVDLDSSAIICYRNHTEEV